LGWKPAEIIGKHLSELWTGEGGERLRAFLAEAAATPSATVGPVELPIELGAEQRVIEAVASNLTDDPAVRGLALNFRDISDRKVLEAVAAAGIPRCAYATCEQKSVPGSRTARADSRPAPQHLRGGHVH